MTRIYIALTAAAVLTSFGVLHAQITESPNPPAVTHLRISAPAQPREIPDTLFGSFLEPIGHSTYGGLWADVVENPSFEAGLWSAGHVSAMLRERPELERASELGMPLPWEPLDGRQGNRYLIVRGDAANSNQSLLVMGLPGKEVGIAQRVYLPVQRELRYRGSLVLRHVRGNDAVAVSLRRHNKPSEVLASITLHAGSTAWTKLPFELVIKSGAVARLEPVDLVVTVNDDARVLVDNVHLFPTDAVDGMDPDVLAMAKELRSPVVRFGGNFTSAYNWHDGVGPEDKRVSMINPSWGIPEYNTFGTDEFLRFCELIGSNPQVALNLGTGTPQEAADWVRYIDTHFGDRKGGLLWELGNELWGDFQIGYPSVSKIAETTKATSDAVRAVSPKARLIATGGDEDSYREWNAQQLKNPPETFEWLSTHFVVTDNVRLQNSDADFRTEAALALPWGLASKMQDIHKQMAQAGHQNAHVAFTEWLMISDSRTGPNFTNMGGALFAGGFLNMVMRNSDVVTVSDMTGILEFGGIWKKREQVYGAPAYWVLREYSQARPHWLMEVRSDGGTYSVAQGINRLPEIEDVPYLDCSAGTTENKRTLVLTCVNRHLFHDLQAEITFKNMQVTAGTAAVSTIDAESILTENDEHRPNRVTPVRETVPLQGTLFTHSFPAHSVTVVRIPLQSER